VKFDNVYLPYRAYWSTPFCRWQGSLAGEHPLKLAAASAAAVLAKRGCEAARLDGIHFGMTVPQRGSFYGAPWLAALIGADHITGPTINQACATSARVLASAGAAVETGASRTGLAVAADRVSNGPHLYYPDPAGPGGRGQSEDWVWDNFNCDPHAGVAMVETAENVAARAGISRAEQDALTLRRYAQYEMALADGGAFQRGYMQPVALKSRRGTITIAEDEGVTETTRDGLAKLKPVRDGGTVTFASQTHPADGNAGMLVTNRAEAEALGADSAVSVQLLAFGEGRAEKAHMGMAPVPAAQAALDAAGLSMADIAVIKSHNPFAVNDIYFARQMNIAAEEMNNYGSSLIYGHPQGPTGMRLVIELIEELVAKGGGHGLFTGCAAGDTAAAIVVKADVR
jgi:acetyl-CoA acetyltransferase family protein